MPGACRCGLEKYDFNGLPCRGKHSFGPAGEALALACDVCDTREDWLGACLDPYRNFRPRPGLETWDARQPFTGGFALLADGHSARRKKSGSDRTVIRMKPAVSTHPVLSCCLLLCLTGN